MDRWPAAARYAAALVPVVVVTVFIGQVLGRTQIANVSMLYLAAVLATATFLGRGPAIAASIASFLSFNWFFVEPLHTVTVADPTDLFTLVLFLLTAVVTGQLAADQRSRANEARQREREALVLYDVVRALSARPLDDALHAVAERIRLELALDAVAVELTADDGTGRRVVVGAAEAAEQLRRSTTSRGHVLGGGHPPSGGAHADPGRWVRVVPPVAGLPSEVASRLHSVPMISGDRRRGTLLLVRGRAGGTFSASDDRLLSAAASQIAAAVEREALAAQATEAEVLRRADAAKSALLQAVSHDLRTPLSSIIAGATSLRQRDVLWTDEEREGFLAGIEDEARRLDRVVGDLLSVSRIESGEVRPTKELRDIDALIDDVVGRIRSRTRHHRIVTDVPPGLPPVALDYVEIDQVLTNLIENATKYAPEESTVTVRAALADGDVRIDVTDEGPGVPVAAARRIFEPFERADAGMTRPGTGLGLAVAKRFVEAHGGRIWVGPREEGGSVFSFTLPLAR